MIAVFGPKTFSVSWNRIYPITGFSYDGDIQIEEQELEGQKPSTYIKGPGLDNLSISIPLRQQPSVDVRQEFESWTAIKDAQEPYMFILGNKPLSYNRFLLTNVSMADPIIDGTGNITKGTIELQFKEFARYGYKKDTEEMKSTAKRDNPNAEYSKEQLDLMSQLESDIFDT